MTQKILDRLLGYRKVLITFTVFTVSVILLVGKVITGDQWVELNKFVLPAFLAANLISKFITPKNTTDSSE